MPNSIGSIYRSYPRRQLVLAGCGMGVFALAAGCVVWDLAVGPERGIAAVAAASLGLGIIFLLGTLGRQATRPKYEVGDGLAARMRI